MDCPESNSLGYVIHNMFFDAFVDGKTTKNIRYQLPLHVFLCNFRSSLVIVSITLEVFVAFRLSDCPCMCFGLACIFTLCTCCAQKSVYIVTHSYIHKMHTSISHYKRKYFKHPYFKPFQKINTVWWEAINVSQTLCQLCWRMSPDVFSPLLHIQKELLVFSHDLPDTQRWDNVTVKIVVNMVQSFHLSMEGLGYQKLQSSTLFWLHIMCSCKPITFPRVTSMYLSTWTAVGFVKDHLYFFFYH